MPRLQFLIIFGHQIITSQFSINLLEIANHPDALHVFGDATVQASLAERAEHFMQRYRLVGLNHELEFWPTAHSICPPFHDHWGREYDPSGLIVSEKWGNVGKSGVSQTRDIVKNIR